MSADTLARLLAPAGADDVPVVVVPPPLAAMRARLRRPPDGWRPVAVHRFGGDAVRGGRVAALVARARSSALVELRPVSATPAPSLLHAIAHDARATLTGAPHATSMGAVIVPAAVHGSSAVVRIGPGAAAEAGALRALVDAGANLPAPRLLGDGVTGGMPWVVETRLPGVRPRRLTPTVMASASAFVAQLPASPRPTAWRDDVEVVRTNAAQWSDRLDAIAAVLHRAEARVPGVLRHGDFWLGNLLVDRGGTVTGVVDWDAWQPTGFPGTDLVHLVATADRHRRKVPLGTVVLDRPWENAIVSTAPVWVALECEPDAALLDAVGVAYWLGQVAGDLRRTAPDRDWVAANVDAVLASRVLPV